jgi:undecaprenyl-diphosphatase
MDSLTLIKAIIMGVVEGITEFLPISSTGHLIATAEIIGFYTDPADTKFNHLFSIVIQLGAILAVLALFRQRVWRLVSTLHNTAASRVFVAKLAVAFIPAGIIGLATHKFVEKYLMNTATVATMLVLGGVAILLIERRKTAEPRYTDAMNLPWGIALAVGSCQCLSLLLPGTSRAAATILGGLMLGLNRPAATEFSFFLAIPTMLAATSYSLLKHRDALHDAKFGVLAVGFIVSFIVAWIVIAWLIRFVSTHTFTIFGWYRIVAGLILGGLILTGVVSMGVH